uniref:Major Facilitator-like protein 5 n=1 Tax=Hadrurus spadix TaxID=141984 RepID=A0A1W7RA76_9SCOR
MANVIQWKGVFCVAGGFLIHLTLGTFYTFGNMNTYITSYLRKKVDSDVDYSKSIWVNAAAMLGQGSLMMIGGILEQRIGARWTCLLGCSIFSGSIALTTFAIKRGFVAVIFTYGLISSLGLGIAYVAPLAAGMKWFTTRKGLVNGIIVGGYGLGALVFNQVQTSFLNPENVVPTNGYFDSEDILARLPDLFLLLGGTYFAVQLIGIILLYSPEDKWGESYSNLLRSEKVADETDQEETDQFTLKETPDLTLPAVDHSLKPIEVLRKKEFYMLWFSFAFNVQAMQFINTMYKAYGQQFIHDDHFLATVGSIASVFNALGRIAWGYLQDRTSYKMCMLILCAALTSLMLSLIATPNGGKPMFLIWIVSIFFAFSGIFVLLPTVTAHIFGPKHAGTNYGMLFTAPAISSLLGAFAVQIVLSSLGWFGTFCLIASFSFAVGIITCFFPGKAEDYHYS